MTEREDDCPLTPRELHAARVVGEHYACKMRRVVILLGVALAIGTSGNILGWILTRNESIQRTTEINQSRFRLLVDNCESSNARNRNTKATVDELAPKRASSATRRAIVSTKLLIDALSPYTVDCETAARGRLSP